jgi:signal transduction histidine kinase
MEMAEDEKRKRFSNMIVSEGTRMSRLIDDLLTLARMDSAQLSISMASVELDTLLLDTAEKFDSLAAEKQISLSITLPEEALPPCLGDRERLIQVFSILLDNAISYTPKGGRIGLSLKLHHGKLQVRIADSGPGIPDDAKELIWNRFYRVDQSHNDRAHFGLGLSIAREIILKHKGGIRAEDAADYGGAAFLVILPVNL